MSPAWWTCRPTGRPRAPSGCSWPGCRTSSRRPCRRGFAETLRYPHVRADDALAEDALDVILTETEHLTELVDRLLAAARLEAGLLRLELDDLDPGPLVDRVAEEFRRAHADRVWEVDVADRLPVVRADPVRVREVLHNLLSNAVKYSSPGSRVQVRAAATEAGELAIAVADEGIGIGAAERPHVFERFYRASDRAEGTGLGLYMSAAIVAAHGGRIDLDSEPGRGSTFVVVLPPAAEAGP
jgi:signal transduction histidine kinase